jgi:hypothetical protein
MCVSKVTSKIILPRDRTAFSKPAVFATIYRTSIAGFGLVDVIDMATKVFR